MNKILNSYEDYTGSGHKELEIKLKWNIDRQLFSDKNLEILKSIPQTLLVDSYKERIVDFYSGSKRIRVFPDQNKTEIIEKERIATSDLKDWELRVSFSVEKQTQDFKVFDLIRSKNTTHYVLKYKTTTISVDVSDVITIEKKDTYSDDMIIAIEKLLVGEEPVRDVEIELLETRDKNWKQDFNDIVFLVCKSILKTETLITFKERTDILNTMNKQLLGKDFAFVKFKPNQPLPLTVQDFQSGMLQKKHSVSLKYDGLRKLLFGINVGDKIYFGYTSPGLNVISKVDSAEYKGFYNFLLDGELVQYEKLSVYCAFDIILYGTNLTNDDLFDIERKGTGSRLLDLKRLFKYLGDVAKFKFRDQNDPSNVKTVSNLPGLNLVLVKKLHKIPNPYNTLTLNETIKSIYNDAVVLPGYKNAVKFNDDGLIFTPLESNYYGTIYKWKPIEKLTIDFYVMDGGILGVQSNKIVPFTGSSKYPIKPQIVNVDTGKIGEFLWENGKFKFERWRDEKTTPNFIDTAKSNWNLIQEPLTLDMIMEKSTRLMDLYHKSVRRDMLKFIKTKGIETIIDIGSSPEMYQELQDSNLNIYSVSKNTKSSKKIKRTSLANTGKVRAITCFNLQRYGIALVEKIKDKFKSENTCYFSFIALDRKNVLRRLVNDEYKVEKDGTLLFHIKRTSNDTVKITTETSVEEYILFSIEDFINDMNETMLFNLVPVVDEFLNMNKKNFFQYPGISEAEKQISELYRAVILKRDVIPFQQELEIKNMFVLKPKEAKYFDTVKGVDFYRIGVPVSTSSFFYAISQIFYKDFRTMSEEKKIEYIRGLRLDLSVKLSDDSLEYYHYYPTIEQVSSICSVLKINIVIVDAYSRSLSGIIQETYPTCFLLFFDQHYEILGTSEKEDNYEVIFNPENELINKFI